MTAVAAPPVTPESANIPIAPKNAPPPKLRFARSEGFQRALKERVDNYFKERSLNPRDVPAMYLKTATIFAWTITSYLLLVFWAPNIWAAIPLCIALAFGVAGIGFNVQHDGGHKGYSDNKLVNRLMAWSLDLIGGSSYMWNFKHNSMHHIYSNIHGYDDDLEIGILARLSPHQKRYWAHRFQHIYLWFLYGFAAIKWHFVDDFVNAINGHLNGHPFQRPRGWDLFGFLFGKLLFTTWAILLPLYFHPIPVVLGFYVFTAMTVGILISTIFQLAHCVEGAEFPLPDEEYRIESEWMIHQIETTVDFSRENPFLCWYLGGLNMQVIHHLFPQVCHIHYPRIARIVEETCREFEVPYKANGTFWGAVASHYRYLRNMGRPEAA